MDVELTEPASTSVIVQPRPIASLVLLSFFLSFFGLSDGGSSRGNTSMTYGVSGKYPCCSSRVDFTTLGAFLSISLSVAWLTVHPGVSGGVSSKDGASPKAVRCSKLDQSPLDTFVSTICNWIMMNNKSSLLFSYERPRNRKRVERQYRKGEPRLYLPGSFPNSLSSTASLFPAC